MNSPKPFIYYYHDKKNPSNYFLSLERDSSLSARFGEIPLFTVASDKATTEALSRLQGKNSKLTESNDNLTNEIARLREIMSTLGTSAKEYRTARDIYLEENVKLKARITELEAVNMVRVSDYTQAGDLIPQATESTNYLSYYDIHKLVRYGPKPAEPIIFTDWGKKLLDELYKAATENTGHESSISVFHRAFDELKSYVLRLEEQSAKPIKTPEKIEELPAGKIIKEWLDRSRVDHTKYLYALKNGEVLSMITQVHAAYFGYEKRDSYFVGHGFTDNHQEAAMAAFGEVVNKCGDGNKFKSDSSLKLACYAYFIHGMNQRPADAKPKDSAEPVGWLLTRDNDLTFPRLYIKESDADHWVKINNVSPKIKKQAVYSELVTANKAEAPSLHKDSARLDWMIAQEAYVGWGQDGEKCALYSLADDGKNRLNHNQSFRDPRDAIDHAITLTPKNEQNGTIRIYNETAVVWPLDDNARVNNGDPVKIWCKYCGQSPHDHLPSCKVNHEKL